MPSESYISRIAKRSHVPERIVRMYFRDQYIGSYWEEKIHNAYDYETKGLYNDN